MPIDMTGGNGNTKDTSTIPQGITSIKGVGGGRRAFGGVVGSGRGTHLFVSGTIMGDEPDVVEGEATNAPNEEEDVNSDGKGDGDRGILQGLTEIPVAGIKNGGDDAVEGKTHDVESENGGGEDEADEEAIIALSHAVIEPETMMIMILNTVVTGTAVACSWRPIDLTGIAVFDLNELTTDLDVTWGRGGGVLGGGGVRILDMDGL